MAFKVRNALGFYTVSSFTCASSNKWICWHPSFVYYWEFAVVLMILAMKMWIFQGKHTWQAMIRIQKELSLKSKDENKTQECTTNAIFLEGAINKNFLCYFFT